MSFIKKHFKAILIVMIALAFTAVFAFRFIQVNRAYPKAELQQVYIHEPLNFKGYRLTALKTEMTPATELQQQGYKLDYEDFFKDRQIFFVDLLIEKTVSADPLFSISWFELQSGSWSNGQNLDLMTVFNEDLTARMEELQTVGKTTIRLVFDVMHEHFHESDWQHVSERKYDLVLSLYPVKNILHLYDQDR